MAMVVARWDGDGTALDSAGHCRVEPIEVALQRLPQGDQRRQDRGQGRQRLQRLGVHQLGGAVADGLQFLPADADGGVGGSGGGQDGGGDLLAMHPDEPGDLQQNQGDDDTDNGDKTRQVGDGFHGGKCCGNHRGALASPVM